MSYMVRWFRMERNAPICGHSYLKRTRADTLDYKISNTKNDKMSKSKLYTSNYTIHEYTLIYPNLNYMLGYQATPGVGT
jgi:hypothetical protein